jgi:hypothetical protein
MDIRYRGDHGGVEVTGGEAATRTDRKEEHKEQGVGGKVKSKEEEEE